MSRAQVNHAMTKVQTRREQEVPNPVARGAWEAMASKAIQTKTMGAHITKIALINPAI